MLLKAIAVLLFVSLASAYITGIETDVTSGQVYVTDLTYLYEIDNVDLTQNAAHNLPQNGPASYVTDNSLFVTKIGGKRRLYATFSYGNGESDDGANVAYFKVPIGNQKTLPLVANVKAGDAPAHDVVYNKNKNIAIMGNSRNLTLVDLTTMKVLDQAQSVFRVRTGGYNFVINPNTNTVYKFNTYHPIRGAFGLSVSEYDISTGKIVEKETSSYDCQCSGADYEQSPFYRVELIEEACRMDVPNNRIWCANNPNVDPEDGNANKEFFNFQADDLSKFTIVKVSVNYDFVVYDFADRKAYAIDSADTVGFTVYKLNLDTGALLGTYINTDLIVSEYMAKLDPAEPNLYIPVYSTDAAAGAKLVAIKTKNMSAKVISLTTAGYF